MQVGLRVNYAVGRVREIAERVRLADDAGLDSVWTAESYGPDALSPLAYYAAITTRITLGTGVAQMPARTPAAMAMTAMTIDDMSGGRLRLGLGVSGAQVVEGWHGIPYGRPMSRTREYVGIFREMIARERPVSLQGRTYRLPYDGDDATGLGKPLKLIQRPLRPQIPVYLAAIGPKNVALTAEIADGWILTFYSPHREAVMLGDVDVGLRRRTRQAPLEIAASPFLVVGDDLGECRDRVRPWLALHIGGFGAKGANFYTDLACRMGYEAEALQVQDLYLAGRKGEATAAIPAALVDEVALVGPMPRVLEQLSAWRGSRVTQLLLRTTDVHAALAVKEALS